MTVAQMTAQRHAASLAGLIRAELLKMRRRRATYVILAVAVLLMVGIFFLAGINGAFSINGLIEFPQAYLFIDQFAFGLGGLLAIVYAAAYIGADWNWGVVRNVVARGESRARYVLAKALALAIVLAIYVLIMFVVGIVTLYIVGLIAGIPVGSPLRGNGLLDLVQNAAMGYIVLIERASLGVAVAVLLRSQLAGAVIGIVFFIGESIVRVLLIGLSVANLGGFLDEGGLHRIGPEWYQYLPISVGDYVLNAAPGNTVSISGGLEQFILNPVPLTNAIMGVFAYLVIAMVISVVAINRQEIA
jgi:ABC-type transport system involved in multi-copper enzyme maturation permease subunit